MARPAHGYTLADGTPVAGVTTICGMLNKPALVGWAGKTMHEYCVQMTKEAYAAGKAGAKYPGLKRWTDVLYGQRDDAASAGTEAHELFEAHLRGKPVEWDDNWSEESLNAYSNAVEWLAASALKIEPHERPLVSEGWRFGGTPDALAHQSGKTFLADWKTGGGIYPEQIMQMAAYRALIFECDGLFVDGAHLVRFPREGNQFHHHYISSKILDVGWDAFLLLLQLIPMQEMLEKAAK